MKPLVCLLLLSAAASHARDREFEQIVRAMEAEYGQQRLYIPLLGVANFFVKTIRPAGARDFKLAVFEDVDSRFHPSGQRLDDMVTSLPGQSWSRFVRVQSNRKRERVYVYSRRAGKDWELLVAALERNEAVIVRVRVNPDGLAKWVNHPVLMASKKGAN